MNPTRLLSIAQPTTCDAVAAAVIEAGVAPDAAAGCAARVSNRRWVAEDGGERTRFFDLASVTKSMTAIAIAASGMELDAPLEAYLDEARGTPSAGASIEALLAHRAGLKAHIALFEPMLRDEPVNPRDALRAAASACAASNAPLYSDLGYILAGAALARHLDVVDAGAAIDRLVIAPLGLGAILGTARDLEARGVDILKESVPTEVVPWRGGEIRGRVHDENAWALSGRGGSGHAGMFGTVGAVIAFGRAVLDGLQSDARPFGHDVDVARLLRSHPDDATLRAGFDGKSREGSSAGERASVRAFGHLGFTGTSLWIDPDAEAVVSLLTNRVNPTRDHALIRAARPEVHDALFARAESLRQG